MPEFSAEVCFASPSRQALITVTVVKGTSIRATVMHSLLPSMFPEYDFSGLSCGIFGQAVNADRPVQPGDRIEVYRPLIYDPKQRRRNRAER